MMPARLSHFLAAFPAAGSAAFPALRLAALGVLAALLFTASAAVPALAQTKFVGNTEQALATGSLAVGKSGANTWRHAQLFTTGSNTDGYTLSSVDVRIGSNTGSNDDATKLKVSLYSTSSSNPNTSLAALTNPSTFTDNAVNTFTAPSGTTLSASTTYAIVLEGTDSTKRALVSRTDSNAEDSGAASGWSIDDQRRTSQNNAAWQAWDQGLLIAIKGTLGTTSSDPSITIAAGTSPVTEGTAAQFTLTASAAPSAALTVNLTVSESSNGDYVASGDEGAKTVTIGSGSTTATYSVTTQDDTTDETNGSVTVTVGTGTGYTVGTTSSATVSVNDNDDPANNAPTVANAIPNQTATVGTAFSYVFPANTFNDADNDTLTYTATKSDDTTLPAWLTFTASTRTFSGTPTATGTVAVKVKASDGTASVTDTFDIAVSAAKPAAPAAPTVGATSGSNTSLDVSWSAPANNGAAITDYDVRYKLSTASSFSTHAHTGTTTSATIAGLTSGSTYNVQVRATNSAGTGAWSPSGNGTTSTPTNSPATGAPTISGFAQVGNTLTAATGGISDADGLTSPTYSYQWIRVDGTTETNISGATSSTYTLVAADSGKKVKVKVSFTDDASNAEELTSTATGSVAAAAAACTSGNAWCGTLTVGENSRTNAGARGYCATAAGTGRCSTAYGALSDTDFTLNGVTYTVESVRWGTKTGAARKIHLTLDKDLPSAHLPKLTLKVDSHSFALNSASRGNKNSNVDNNYNWSVNTTIQGYATGLQVRVEILDSNTAPTVANAIPDQSATTGTAFSYAFPANTFSDGDGDTLSYTATKADNTALPSWLSFAASTRTFSGTPAAAGTVSVKVTASDSIVSVSDEFDIVVSASSSTPGKLVGNTGQSTDATSNVGVPRAQAFTTGSVAYTLTRVDVQTTGGASGHGVTLKIESSNASNRPGGSLGALTFSSATASSIRFTTTGINLQPSTTYFVVWDATSQTTTVKYNRTSSNAEDSGGVTGWSIGDGSLWKNSRSETSWRTSATKLKMEVYGKVSPATVPTVSKATLEGTALKITFDQDLDTSKVPAGSAFAVKLGGTAQTLASMNPVAISGKVVTLTLASAPGAGTVTVDYTAPGTGNKLTGTNGEEVANFSGQAVKRPATFSSATTNAAGTGITITFNKDIKGAGAASAYTVSVAGTDRTPTAASSSGKTVSLTLDSAHAAGPADTVTVSYAKPTGTKLTDTDDLEVASFSSKSVTNAVAVAFSSATTTKIGQNWTVVITFNALIKSSDPATGKFTVTAGGTDITPSATLAALNQLNLTLPNTGKQILPGETVTVSYDKDEGTGNKILDRSDNEVASFSNKSVTNTVPVTVTGVEITSDPGPDGTYSGGDLIEVTVTFSAAVTVDTSGGTPTLSLRLNIAHTMASQLKSMSYNRGSGTTKLVFRYTVNAANDSEDPTDPGKGIGLPENGLALNSGTIKLKGGTLDATLTYSAVAHTTSHRVTPGTTDTTAPTLSSAAVSGATLTLTFDDTLDTGASAIPAASAFTVKVNGSEAALADTTPVAIAGSAVTLTLTAAVIDADTVTVSYTKPTENALRNFAAALEAAGFSDQAATNNTTGVAPSVSSAAVAGATLNILFDEALDETSTPAASAFAVTVAGSSRSVSNVAVSGTGVTLTLASAAVFGETVTVSYTKPGTNPLRDKASPANDVASFSGQSVTNNDATAPTFQSAAVAGATLTLTFDENLDTSSVPGTGAFTVTVGNAGRNVSNVAIADATVTLTLASAVARGQTVKVRYAKPGTNPLRDGAMNEVATFADQAAANRTLPAFQSATVNRAAVTLTFDAALDTGSVPAAAAFAVSVAGSARNLAGSNAVAIAGSTVTLTLASAAGEGEAVTGSYSKPGANPLRDGAGNAVAGFSFTATNRTDTTAPALHATTLPTVNGRTLVITFDETLDTGSVPASADFTVTVDTADRGVSNVAVAGAGVTLTLASAVTPGQAVAASYAGTALRDADGNAVAGFGPLDVTNNTARPPQPPPSPPPGGGPGGGPAPSPELSTDTAIGVGESTYEAGDHEVTVRREAGTPAVRLALPGTPTEDVEVTVSAVAPDVPLESGTFGLGPAGARTVVDVDVDNVPAGGLTLCLPVSAGLREAAASEPLLLLRWVDGSWTEVPGAAPNPAGTLVCATLTAFSPFAVGYRADVAPRFGAAAVSSLALVLDEAMEPVVLPAATGGNGKLSYSLTSAPAGLAGLTIDAAARRLSGTPTVEGGHVFTWTAHDADANRAASDAAVLSFAVTVENPRTVLMRKAIRGTLSAVAKRALTSALENIGARLASSIPGSSLTLAGETVPLDAAGLAGLDGAEADGACAGLGPLRHGFAAEAAGCPPAGTRSRGAEAEQLMHSSGFSLALGAAAGEDAPSRPLWAVWGRGDLGSFAGRPEAGIRYDGEMRTGWLGMDARAGRWVAGIAVSHGTGEAEYGFDRDGLSGRGRLETTLSAFYPYGRWTFDNGLELRGVLGAGAGEARHLPDGEEEETSDLSMRMGSVGLRRALPALGGIDLAVRAEASLARLETGSGPQYVDNLSADSWRLRAGLEASRRVALGEDEAVTPFVEAAGRRDGGDGLSGDGLELAGGVRYGAPGVQIEARGRWLAAHTEEGARERGVSVTARAGPGAGGRGLSLMLNPRWGAPAGGAEALWRDEMPRLSGTSGDAAGSVDAQIGYGVALAPSGLLTPFAEAGVAGDDGRRLRVGTRFDAGRMDLGIELAGERRESGAAEPEHALRLGVDLRF